MSNQEPTTAAEAIKKTGFCRGVTNYYRFNNTNKVFELFFPEVNKWRPTNNTGYWFTEKRFTPCPDPEAPKGGQRLEICDGLGLIKSDNEYLLELRGMTVKILTNPYFKEWAEKQFANPPKREAESLASSIRFEYERLRDPLMKIQAIVNEWTEIPEADR